MSSDAMGRCGQCGREMTTGGCPQCSSMRVYNYSVTYAPPCAKCAQLERDLAAARAEAERERMRLAACGVAALQNTEASIAVRLEPGHEYYSASYGDVCRAVDREMAHRAEAARLREAIDDLCRGLTVIEHTCDHVNYDHATASALTDLYLKAKDALDRTT